MDKQSILLAILEEPNNAADLLDFDHISNQYPDNCYFIDRFPLLVEDADTFNQLDIFFDAARSGGIPSPQYIEEEKRFKRFFRMLWAYSQVNVMTALYDIEKEELDLLLKPLNPESKN